MPANKRLIQIEELVNQRGFISVRDLCEIHHVSEMTIRRDLQQLDEQGRLKRTFGGAASLRLNEKPGNHNGPDALSPSLNNVLTNRVDAIIATSLEKHIDRLLLDQANKKDLPVVAESPRLIRKSPWWRWTIIRLPTRWVVSPALKAAALERSGASSRSDLSHAEHTHSQPGIYQRHPGSLSRG